uniref:hypothetical protein n=1 Tax=Pseudomonas tructae TaxID=2518644 RepID=UPI00389A8803
MRKNKEKPRDFYANETVWQAVYMEAPEELKDAIKINDLSDASVLLGHSKERITERVYRRVGAIAKPSKG